MGSAAARARWGSPPAATWVSAHAMLLAVMRSLNGPIGWLLRVVVDSERWTASM